MHEKLGIPVQLGRIDEAYREYTLASRIVDGQPLPQTEEALRAAIAASPQSAEARIALADLLLTRGDLDEAEDHLLVATVSDPSNELANRALAALYVSEAKPDLAEKHLRAAAGHQPQRYRSQVALADFLIEHGRNAEARTVLDAAAHGDPGLDAAVKLRLASIDYDTGAREKAQTDLAGLLKAGPTAGVDTASRLAVPRKEADRSPRLDSRGARPRPRARVGPVADRVHPPGPALAQVVRRKLTREIPVRRVYAGARAPGRTARHHRDIRE